MSTAVGAPGVIEAVREFLEDGTHGGSGSPAPTLNETLALIRTDEGLSTADGINGDRVDLPDIVAFDDWYAIGEYGQAYPRVGIVWAGHSGEAEAINQQRFEHRIEIVIVVAAADLSPTASVPFGEAHAHAKSIGYYDQALTTMFLRRTPRDGQGKALNNGGTGRAQGRIVFARYDGIRDVTLFGEDHAPLLAATATLIVRVLENV